MKNPATRLFLGTLLISVFALLGCTQAPSPPELPHRNPLRIQNIVIDDDLSADDIRSIFTAINQDGKLNSLKRFFSEASDREFNDIAKLIERYLFRQADIEGGFTHIIAKRQERGGFSQWHQAATSWAAEPEFSDALDGIFYLTAKTSFPQLVHYNKALLDSLFANTLERLKQSTNTYEERFAKVRSTAAPSSAQLLRDSLRSYFADSALKTKLIEVGAKLNQFQVPTYIMRAFQQLDRDKGSIGVEGFGKGLQTMLVTQPERRHPTYQNQLDLFLHFANTANQGTERLFSLLQRNFDEDPGFLGEVVGGLNRRFSPAVRELILDLIEGELKQSNEGGTLVWPKTAWLGISQGTQQRPSEQFYQLFLVVKRAMENVARPTTRARQFTQVLNAYALTVWMAEALSQAENRRRVNALAQPFGRNIWTVRLQFPAKRIEFAKRMGRNIILPFERAFTHLEFEPTYHRRIRALFAENLESFLYLMPEGEFSMEEAFRRALAVCEAARPYSIDETFVRTMVLRLTRPAPGWPVSLDSFETSNLMTSANQWLSALDLTHFRRFKNLAFENLGLGRLSEDNRNFLINLYVGHENLQSKVRSLLDSVQMIYEFDKPAVRGLPSAFEAYHEWLQQTPPRHLPGIGALLSYLSQTRLFSQTERELAYPGVFRWLAHDAFSFSKWLYGFSKLSEADQSSFRGAFTETFSTDGLPFHVNVLADWLSTQSQGVLGVLKLVEKYGWECLPNLEQFTSEERSWFQRFIKNEDFAVLWQVWTTHMDRPQSLQLVQELLRLQSQGVLSKMFDLLGYVRNERIQKIADTLLSWDRSGQLREFLLSLETILQS